MTCNKCGEKPKKACGAFPKAVIEIDNPEKIVLLRKVLVPASMGDDTTVPPTIGKYHNVLLYYEANQKSYLYSSDGIPTQLVNGVTDYEAAVNLPQINGVTLLGDKSAADLELADAPMVIHVANGNTSWSGADTAEDVYDFFLNKGKVNIIFNGDENYSYEIASAAYIPGEEKMMCTLAVATIVSGEPTEFEGNALFGTMTLYTANKAIDVSQIELQPKLYIADFTGLDLNYNELSGVPATNASIGMVKSGDGLEVASDGTLSISDIEQYAHFFGTVADLEAATNVAVGSSCMTYGYLRLGDGVYNRYKIREITNADIVDGYNIVSISATDNLVAERIQSGKELIIELNTSDSIQDYMSIPDSKTIRLPKNANIEVSDALILNSNTTIDLNESQIYFNYARPASFPAVNWDETLGFMGFSSTDVFTGYNGHKNITIKNGTIKGGCSCFIHNVNVNLTNLSFTNLLSRHALQFAGCKDIRIENCRFNGSLRQSGADASSECVNLDPCTHGGQPWVSSSSPIYDLTPIKNFVFNNNVFNRPTTEGQFYGSAVGSHSIDSNQTLICENIEITNNSFGTPYAHTIGIGDYKDVTIANNSVEFSTTEGEHDTYTYFVRIRGGLLNATITDNNVRNVGQFIYTDGSTNTRKNLLIASNYVHAIDLWGYAVFQLFHYEDVSIDNNTISCVRRVFQSDGIVSGGSFIEGTESKNVNFEGNHITCRTGGDKLIRGLRTIGWHIIDNDIEFIGPNNMTWDYYAIEIETGVTGPVVMFNRCTDPKHFIKLENISDKVMYNNAEYMLSSTSGTTQSGTLAASIENFTRLRLPVGTRSNTQFIDLYPWTDHNRNRFYWGSDTSRTYKFPVVKDDGTVGSGSLTINNDATFTYSYTGDLSLRGIYAYD